MRIFYFFIFLCLVGSAAFVFKEYNPPQPEYKDTLQKVTLDNGLTVITKSSNKVPVVAVRFIIKAGSATEGKYAGSGISHFVEHMLFKGTASRQVGEVERQIKSYGGYINAATSYDSTEVQIIVKSEYLDKVLELLADFAFNTSFDKTEFEKEREVILSEIRMNRDEPSRRASLLLWGNAYLVHPYKHPVIGYEDLFRKIKREDLLEYHSASYVPNNCVLSIVGDIDSKAALKSVKDIFGKLPRRSDFQALRPEEPVQMSTREADEELPGLKLSYLLIAFHSTSLLDRDLYALDIIAAALGQGESSRLYNKLVRDKKLAYSVSVYNYTPQDPGLFIIALTLEEDKIGSARAEVLKELEAVKAHSLLKGELNKVKRSVLSGYIYSKESIEAQADDYASNYAFTGDYNFSKKYVEGIGAVGTRALSKAANKYFKPENMTVAVVTPQKKKAESAEVTPKKAGKFDIKKVVLPNGVTLLMCEEHSFPVVSMSILFKGGLRAEDKKTNGVSSLVSDMLLKGTRSHSAEWIAKETEARGIIFTNFSGRNSFGVSVKCLKDDFDFSFGLMSDILKESSFPEKEIEIQKSLQLAAIKAQDDNVFATASKTLLKTIYRIHPYGLPDLGTKDSVTNLKRGDLVAYYRRFAVPDNMVVSIFGDIDVNKVEAKAEKMFGGLHGDRLGEIKALEEPGQTGPREMAKKMHKEQSVLMIGYPGARIDDPDKYALDVINSIFSREGGRLYMDIREKLGLSYTLGSYSVLGIDPGYNVFYVATTYKNIDQAKRLVLNQIKLMKAEGPTGEEMDLAKQDLTGAYLRSLEINSEVGFKSGLDELYGLGYDNLFKYTAKIQAVTAGDVMRIANKYFVDSKLNEAVIFPDSVPEPDLAGEIKLR